MKKIWKQEVSKYNSEKMTDAYGLEDFSPLIGVTPVRITRENGGDGDKIIIDGDNGWTYAIFHHQDCCEGVWLEDIVGDLEDLVGHPILEAERVTNNKDPMSPRGDADEGYTWTYIKLGGINGHVNIRFFGTSNGYYSEDATLDIYREEI